MIILKDTFGSTLAGAIDGSNRVYTTRAAFLPDSVNIYVNGLLKVRDFDDGFTVTSPTTVTLKEALVVGDTLEVWYEADVRGGGGADGGVPDPPSVDENIPDILNLGELVPGILNTEKVDVDEDD